LIVIKIVTLNGVRRELPMAVGRRVRGLRRVAPDLTGRTSRTGVDGGPSGTTERRGSGLV